MKYLVSIILILTSLSATARPSLPLYREGDLVCARTLSDNDWQTLVFKGPSSYPALYISEFVPVTGRAAYMVDATAIIPPNYKYTYLNFYIRESDILGIVDSKHPTCKYPK